MTRNNKISKALLAALAAVAVVRGQSTNCPSNDSGQCDLDPVNPVVCGAPDYACGYGSFCLAEAAGYSLESDCCQAPQPSGCAFIYEPYKCGSKGCPYDNLCLAELAGYTSSQCTRYDPPAECPSGDSSTCGGEPSNPVVCGFPGLPKSCAYDNFCSARSAGYVLETDCCQDVRGNTACTMNIEPVSCGPPEKQCSYDNQCLAEAAGYASNACCRAPPEQVACTQDFTPVSCGNYPNYCQYGSGCLATAAGWPESDCCAQATVCTADNFPMFCGDNNCYYSSKSCAVNAGWDPQDCCKQPKEVGACPMNIDPQVCGNKDCIYDNFCIAELSGFTSDKCRSCADPATCRSPVSKQNANVKSSNPNNATSTQSSSASSPFTANILAQLMIIPFLAAGVYL